MMRSRKFLALAALLVGVAMLGVPTQARAEFQMKISWTSGGGGSILIHDNDANDTTNPFHTAVGAIHFSGTVGEFFIQVNTGVSKPVSGTAAAPDMDLTFSATKLSGSGAETLTIQISDVDFITSPLTLQNAIGGTLSGAITQVSATASFDNGNANFGSPDGSTLPLTFTNPPGGAYSGTNFLGVTGAAPYSLTQTVVINANAGAGTVSGDHELNAVPAPAGLVLALSGTPVLGLGTWLRRRRSVSAA